MTAILDLSAHIIDSGDVTTSSNRISNELSPVADRVWIIESFSHVVLVETDDGLVAFDSSSANFGPKVMVALRGWTDEPINTLVYTHGHVDHTGGSRHFAADAEDNSHRRPRVLGHRNLARRHDRYRRTNGYNQTINLRQFGGLPSELSAEKLSRSFVVDGTMPVTVDYEDDVVDEVGSLRR